MSKIKIGFAFCGSFCSFEKVYKEMAELIAVGAELWPILSFNAGALDTRFGTAKEWRERLVSLSGHSPIDTICGAEPIGPKKMFDILVVCPCTGNTLAKLASGITDTPVTMAVKSHLRGAGPVLLGVSTNDGLAASAQNIGRLLNTKHFYFVPFMQDDPYQKPTSLVADFTQIASSVESALSGRQIKPVLF